MELTRLEIYGDDEQVYDSILFTSLDAAEAAREELMTDEGMAGIARIEVVTGILVDGEGVNQFYHRVMADSEVDPFAGLDVPFTDQEGVR